jgi:3-hydroxybutyryl-CoA dehydrogenase
LRAGSSDSYLLEEKMNERTEQKIGVVGGGLMGHGIAYLFAAAGHHVNVFEPFPAVRNSLPRRLQAIVELLGDDPRLLARIAAHDSLAPAVHGVDWIFEAAPEKLPLKGNFRRDRKAGGADHDTRQ